MAGHPPTCVRRGAKRRHRQMPCPRPASASAPRLTPDPPKQSGIEIDVGANRHLPRHFPGPSKSVRGHPPELPNHRILRKQTGSINPPMALQHRVPSGHPRRARPRQHRATIAGAFAGSGFPPTHGWRGTIRCRRHRRPSIVTGPVRPQKAQSCKAADHRGARSLRRPGSQCDVPCPWHCARDEPLVDVVPIASGHYGSPRCGLRPDQTGQDRILQRLERCVDQVGRNAHGREQTTLSVN